MEDHVTVAAQHGAVAGFVEQVERRLEADAFLETTVGDDLETEVLAERDERLHAAHVGAGVEAGHPFAP